MKLWRIKLVSGSRGETLRDIDGRAPGRAVDIGGAMRGSAKWRLDEVLTAPIFVVEGEEASSTQRVGTGFSVL